MFPKIDVLRAYIIIFVVDSSRLVRIHSVGMRNNAILFDQSIIRK
jgi:hypothetical protein